MIASQGDLSGASLAHDVNVKGMSFAGVTMDRAILLALINGQANLAGINVSGQDLSGMSLINVNFTGANFTDTNLKNANLKGADLTGAQLTGANLENASIHFTVLINANLDSSNLVHAIGTPITDPQGRFEKKPQMFYDGSFWVYNPTGQGWYVKRTPFLKVGKSYEYPNQTRNGKAPFINGNGVIVCRHSSAQFVIDTLSNPKGKVNFRQFSTEQSLTNHVLPESEQIYNKLRYQAKQIHLIPNDNFGAFLSTQFLQMEADHVFVRACLIESSSHAMAFSLRIKTNSAGKKIYGVQFMEPNIGEASPIHSQNTNHHHLATQMLRNYIKNKQNYSFYYKKTEDEYSLVFVHDTASITHQSEQLSPITQLTSCDISELAPIHIWLMMQHNLSIDLLNLKAKLVELSQQDLHEVLGIDGFIVDLPALTGISLAPIEEAFACGHVEAIKAYGELVTLVTDQKKRAELLAVEKYGITKETTLEEITLNIKTAFSQMNIPFEQKHVEALNAYKEIIDKLLG